MNTIFIYKDNKQTIETYSEYNNNKNKQKKPE